MILNWTKTRLKIIPLPKGVKSTGLAGKNKVVLVPGHNTIDDKIWTEMRKMKTIQKSLEIGHLKEIEAEVKEKVQKKLVKDETGQEVEKEEVVFNVKSKDLKDLDTNKVKEIVEDTFNVDTLEKWRKADNRDEVRNLLSDRIKDIKEKKIKEKIGD